MPTQIDRRHFAALNAKSWDDIEKRIGVEQSRMIWEHLPANGYIDADGRAHDALCIALRDGTLSVPAFVADLRDGIAALLRP
jgi:type III restriction enzyme